MSQPIPFRVTRYRCPHCPRTGSTKSRVGDHMARCWYNPAAKSCKTCKHYEGWTDACGCEPGCNWGGSAAGSPEHCCVGVSLAGRPACTACQGTGRIYLDELDLGSSECTACGGDGAEIKPGPIVGCEKWEPAR